MPEYSSTRYQKSFSQKSFLNQVIVRVDFLKFAKNPFGENIEKEILWIFPRRGKDQIIRFNSLNLVFDRKNNGIPNANGESVEGIQQEYLTTDGLNKLILTNKFLIFEINKYTSFEEHKQWFQSILLAFFQKNRVSASRTGIRYINVFDSSNIKLRKNFFSSEIAASLKVITQNESSQLIRSMHMSEYRIDEMTMNFRYGMFNPDYPNSYWLLSYCLADVHTVVLLNYIP